MTIQDVEGMTDAQLADNSAIYQHKLSVAEDREDFDGVRRFAEVVDMIEEERERRAGRELH